MKNLFLAALVMLVIGFTVHTEAQQSRDEQQLLQTVRELDAAVVKRDAAPFRRYLTDDATNVSSNGTLRTKTDLIAAVTQRDNFTKYDSDNLKVRVYGDTAVVTGRATYSGTFDGVQYTNRQVVFTATYVRRNGQWQSVAAQNTALPTQR
jgi:uncharacterized protein (TIGR02246 family)